VDHHLIVHLVKAGHGTDFHAVRELAPDTFAGNDVRHARFANLFGSAEQAQSFPASPEFFNKQLTLFRRWICFNESQSDMKTNNRILCLLFTGFAFSMPSTRADEVKLTAKAPSTVSVAPDGRATDLMPYPIYGFSVHSIAFSPDGSTLATGDGNGHLRLWDTAKGELRTTIQAHQGWVFSIAWFADGKRVITGGKDRVSHIREAAPPWRILKTFEGHSNDVHAVALTADGATLVSAGDDQTIRVWDVSNAQILRTLTGHERQIPTIALSPDGRLIASASRDQTVRLWDLKTGNEVGVLRGHVGDVMSVKFSPNGKLLASASYDSTVRLWDPNSLMPENVLTGHTYRVYNVAFAPNGKQLASAGDHTARLWDLQSGENVKIFTLQSEVSADQSHVRGAVSAVAYSPDGKMLAVASTLSAVHLVSPDTGAVLHILTPPPGNPPR
jgi:WD40 repeat protein